MTNNWGVRKHAFAIAFLRISMGIMFLIASWGKVTAGSDWTPRMLKFLEYQASKTPQWYQQFLEGYVIPNADVFALLTAYGELIVGAFLILGLLTRSALVAGLFMIINFWLTKGGVFWIPSSADSMYMLVMVFLLVVPAGRCYGLDQLLSKKRHIFRGGGDIK